MRPPPAYGGGTGTQDDPWIIATVEDITTLAATVNDGTYYEDAYFKADRRPGYDRC